MTDRWIRSSLVEIMPPLQPELKSQAVVFPPFGALRIASNPEGGRRVSRFVFSQSILCHSPWLAYKPTSTNEALKKRPVCDD
jgi:hypothetical protein